MSNREIENGLPEDVSGESDVNTGIEEEINAAMDKIIVDLEDEELDDLGEYDDSVDDSVEEPDEGTEEDEDTDSEEEPDEDIEESDEDDYEESEEYDEEPQPVRQRRKSARPEPVVYVPIDDMEMPDQKKSGKKKSPEVKKQKEKSAKPEYRNAETPKKHKGAKIFGLIMLMLVVLGGCAYGAASYYFADRFFEGTWINGVNCSQMTASQVEDLFKQKFQNYSIEVSARDQSPQTIAGADISYQYLSTGEVLKLLKQQKPYEWIKGLYKQKSYTVSENTGYNRTQLQEKLKSLSCAQAENQTEPENAYVAYQNGQFVIVPETVGSKLDIKAAYKVLDSAV